MKSIVNSPKLLHDNYLSSTALQFWAEWTEMLLLTLIVNRSESPLPVPGEHNCFGLEGTDGELIGLTPLFNRIYDCAGYMQESPGHLQNIVGRIVSFAV